MSDPPVVSHGRGGQGNIAKDSTKYTDGGIRREGIQGESIDGDYSSGRGGAGNIIASPKVGPRRGSQDKIPDEAMLSSKEHENYHIGVSAHRPYYSKRLMEGTARRRRQRPRREEGGNPQGVDHRQGKAPPAPRQEGEACWLVAVRSTGVRRGVGVEDESGIYHLCCSAFTSIVS